MLNCKRYYSDDSPKYGLGQTDSIGLAGTAHDLSESPLTYLDKISKMRTLLRSNR